MTAPQHIDPERLAALLDGRLSDTEAAAVRAQLANADEDTLAAYADAVAVFAELNPVAVVSIDRGRRRRRFYLSAMAAAAAVVIGVFTLRTPAYQPALFASMLSPASRATDGPVWSVTRGGADGVSDRARSVRIGALLTDLQVDAVHSDSARTHASALATLVEGKLGNGTRAAALRGFVNSSSATLTPEVASAFGRQAAKAADESLMLAGAYLEAARIASAAGDVAFFERLSTRLLSSLGAEANEVSGLIAAQPKDAAAIHAAVERLLRSLTM